ncbi:hypothetical protein GCM10009716_48400 [Streptomyces sodiiphilus]|uniref:Secreted protein n=1 Tax=Streptomyces sodiiphilus TaxID=226217 RepID=A0ABN2PW31_9ACTN
MPLHLYSAPAPAERSVRAALHSSAVPTPHPLQRDRGSLEPASPLPVHRLDPMPYPGAPPRTRLTGWRFLLERRGRAVGAAETVLTPDGWAFSHFLEGPYIASGCAALRQAEAMDGAYQPQLLSVPELYMLTLWLRPGTASDPAESSPSALDLLVPLAPAPPGIASGRPQPVEALLPQLTRRLTPSTLAG